MNSLANILAVALVVMALQARAEAEVVIQAEKAAIKTEGGPVAGGWNLWSNGHVGQPIRIATAGKYGVVVRAWGSPAGGVWPEMALLVDGRAVKTVSVEGAKPKDYAFEVELTTGDHEIAAAFLNDALVGKEDRNLYLARITIIPPSGAPDPTFPSVKEMAEAAEAREQEVVAATKPAIEKNRKADAKIRVVDAAGRPVPGVKLTVEQTGHDFLFGATSSASTATRPRPRTPPTRSGSRSCSTTPRSASTGGGMNRSGASRTTSTPIRSSPGAGNMGFG